MHNFWQEEIISSNIAYTLAQFMNEAKGVDGLQFKSSLGHTFIQTFIFICTQPQHSGFFLILSCWWVVSYEACEHDQAVKAPLIK